MTATFRSIRKTFLAACLCPFLTLSFQSVQAQTEVEGFISGNWTIDNEPYIVVDDLVIEDDEELTIEPGVNVIFDANVSLTVFGKLNAAGEENDSIRFFPNNDDNFYWGGIRFISSNNESRLDYCVLSRGLAATELEDSVSLKSGGNVFIYDSDIIIDHCRISEGHATKYGGGLTIWSGSPVVSNSIFYGNSAIVEGGALAVSDFAQPTFTNCLFIANSSDDNGGAAALADSSKAVFRDCKFVGNDAADWGGAAIVKTGASPLFIKCSFIGNMASVGGALNIRNEGTSPLIDWCYFFSNGANSAPGLGGAVYVRDLASPEISHCRFQANSADNAGGIYSKEEPRSSIHHNLFLNNTSNDGGAVIETSENSGGQPLTLSNCTFVGNRNLSENPESNLAYAQLYSIIQLTSCIIWSDWPHSDGLGDVYIHYSNIKGGYNGVSNSSADPWFFPYDSTFYLLTKGSNCIDTGNPDLPLDPDSTRNDRGWTYYPADVGDDQITGFYSTPTTEEILTETFTYINRTEAPIFMSPTDMWISYAYRQEEVSSDLEDFSLSAMIQVESNFYIAGSNDGEFPNQLYITDVPYDGNFSEMEQPGEYVDGGFRDMSWDGNAILYGCYENEVVEFSAGGELGEIYSGPDDAGDYTGVTVDFSTPHEYRDFYISTEDNTLLRLNSEFGEEDRVRFDRDFGAIGMKHNERAIYYVYENEVSHSILSLYYPDEDRSFDLMKLPALASYEAGGIEVSEIGYLSCIFKGSDDAEDISYFKRLYSPWLITPHRWKLIMPGDSAKWTFTIDGTQQRAGQYWVDRHLLVNGNESGYKIRIDMNSLDAPHDNRFVLPNTPSLTSAYPNPFNAQLTLTYTLPTPTPLLISLYNSLGQPVRSLDDGNYPAGQYRRSYVFSSLPSGTYIIRLETPTILQSQQVTLVK